MTTLFSQRLIDAFFTKQSTALHRKNAPLAPQPGPVHDNASRGEHVCRLKTSPGLKATATAVQSEYLCVASEPRDLLLLSLKEMSPNSTAMYKYKRPRNHVNSCNNILQRQNREP